MDKIVYETIEKTDFDTPTPVYLKPVPNRCPKRRKEFGIRKSASVYS